MSLIATTATCTELLQSLERVFSLLRLHFVHDFVFTSDLVADISILTAPVQIEHAVAARITICGVEKESTFAHVFDYSTDFYFAAVPAFSVGAVTVGFCTKQTARDPSHAMLHEPPMGSSSKVQCHRYVRDDQIGLFALLSEDEGKGLTEIDCMYHQNSRRRTRVCARFTTNVLKSNLRSQTGCIPIDQLVQGLAYLNVCDETRACPVCEKSDDSICQCILPFKRPVHPLDFRNECVNMGLHTGKYQGQSRLKLFKDSQAFVVTDLNTRSIIKGSLDKVLINRLNKYAIEDRMSKLKMNPFAMVMPKSNNPLYDIIARTEGSDPIDDLLKDGFMSNKIDTSLQLQSSMNLFDKTGMNDSTRPPAYENSALQLTPNSFNSPAFWSAMTTLAPQSESTGQSAKEISIEDYNVINMGNNLMNEEENELEKVSPSEGEKEVKVLSEKEIKAQLRKQRNREAAAKSNIKRKIRNEALRRDLKEVHEKASSLRAIEKRLREENVRLRGLANEKKLKVSSHLTHIQISPS